MQNLVMGKNVCSLETCSSPGLEHCHSICEVLSENETPTILPTRFMICCDRCEEWFHGDCVGITEARGRLMERNGEDYICPNCTAKKNQVVRPATTILTLSTDIGKHKVVGSGAASAAEKASKGSDSSPAAGQAVAAPSSSTSEEKGVEDMGIKGRIEKATNPTGKKKIKIFQPVGSCKWKYEHELFSEGSTAEMPQLILGVFLSAVLMLNL